MSKPAADPTRELGLKPKPRKLIVCIDGTSNQFSEKNTNVVELYSRITKDSTQLTYYNSGIGTYARPFWWSLAYLKQQLNSTIDLMIAWNFDQVIVGAYRWLADTYQPGDQIFLFGFSRGAYQVRTLAGMIETVGLIHPGNQEQIPFAWAIYSGDEKESVKLKFKEAFCRKKVDLHFVGVWDTVASVGVLPRKPFPLSNESSHITHFRHALALDERRVKFLPEHVSQLSAGEHTQEEVWFAGTHSDIGGGNKANPTLDRGGEPLKWMMEEAYEQGLSVRLHDVKIGVPHAQVTDSMRANSMRGFLYMFLEAVPFMSWRENLSSGESRSKWRPHLGSAREVLPHQSIHWTVNASLGKNNPNELGTTEKAYSPKAIILDGYITDEEKKRNVKKTIEWKDLKVGEERYGRPNWMDDHQYTRMVEILKAESKISEDEWFTELNNYALGEDSGKPDAIWAYGGPQFLQKLFNTYRDQKNTVKIARLIIGFDSELESSSSAGAPKPTATDEEKKHEQDLAERLQDMVIPRTILLLKGWTAQDVTSEPSEQSGWARVRSWFGLASKETDEADSVDAQWNWDRIPKKTRSIELASVAINILSDATKTRFGLVLQNASEKLANRIMVVMHELTGREERIESAASWEKNQADLAEGVLNLITALFNFGNGAPRDVFHVEDTAGAIRPLICAKEKYPDLSRQAMRTAALLTQDLYCGMDVSNSNIISDLLGMMHEYMAEDNPVKQQLGSEASITLATLTKHSWCCRKINDEPGVMEKLLQVLKAGKHVNEVLQVFKNVSTDYPDQFSLKHIKVIADCMDENADASFTLANLASQYNFDKETWSVFHRNEVATKAVDLLSRQDMQVQAAAQLLKNLIDQELSLSKASGQHLKSSIVLPEVFLALTASLREPSRSQLTIDELLVTTVRFLLLKPTPGNEINVSTLEAEIPGLTTLALSGNQRAILTVSAAFAHNKNDKERVSQFTLSLAQMIALEDQKFLKDSMEVITLLIKEGYILQGFHAKGVMDALVVIIRAIYAAQLFAEDAPMSDWEKEKVTHAAFDLLEALCADASNRNYLTNTGIFETIILESNTGYTTGEVDEQAKAMVDRLAEYEDLVVKIETLRKQSPDPETEPEVLYENQNGEEKPVGEDDDQEETGELEGDSEDSEDESGETDPLMPKD